MIPIVCVDDRFGMAFNKRRCSSDVAVSIKSVPDGFIITDNSEPDTSYHLMFIPMDDDFWARCAAEKETK